MNLLTSHVMMSLWQRSCEHYCFLLSGSSWRDRAPRTTGKSRSTGTVPTQTTVLLLQEFIHSLYIKYMYSSHIDMLQILAQKRSISVIFVLQLKVYSLFYRLRNSLAFWANKSLSQSSCMSLNCIQNTRLFLLPH